MEQKSYFSLSLLVVALGCGQAPVTVPPPNDFVKSVSVVRFDNSKELLPEEKIALGSGGFLRIQLHTQESPPTEYQGRQVQPSVQWPLIERVYRRGRSPQDSRNKIGSCNPIRRRGEKYIPGVPYQGGISGFWRGYGYKGPLREFGDLPETGRLFWTYLAAEKDRRGEYVFEFVVYPTGKPISDLRYDWGPDVVIFRTLLIVE